MPGGLPGGVMLKLRFDRYISAGSRPAKKLATSSFEPPTIWGTTGRCESESLKSLPTFTS